MIPEVTAPSALLASESQPATQRPAQILFLDENPGFLHMLLGPLALDRASWSLQCTSQTADAIALLGADAVDILIVDLSRDLPGKLRLLADVRTYSPDVLRLAGFSGDDAAVAAEVLSVAHQITAPPTSSAAIREIALQAAFLRSLLANPQLKRAVGRLSALPSVPPITFELSRALARPGAAMTDVARIVGRDPALASKVLQIVNSAAVGLSRRVSNIEEAVIYLGAGVVKQLVMLSEASQVAEQHAGAGELQLVRLQEHAFATANLAARIVPDRALASDCFTAGLLHDIGQLLFVLAFPGRSAPIAAAARAEAVARDDIEARDCGVTHADLGAYLLGLWGLPFAIVEAVAQHHQPRRAGRRRFGLTGAVHVADGLAGEGGQLDLGYLEGAGVHDQLGTWQTFATAR